MYSHGTEVTITIYNQGVFGDGNHESTQLVLDMLYKQNPKGKAVLDIGTGSGIQSIYAKKWGAKDVLAVDVEYWAIMTARRNFEKNDVDVKSMLNIFNEQLDFKADIIVANLPAGGVKDFMPLAHTSMKKNAVIICSFPHNFNIYNECDLSEYEVVDKIDGFEYDAFAIKEKK